MKAAKKYPVYRLTVIIRLIKVRALSGAIAQLGERNTGSVEVGGSIPPGSTRFTWKILVSPSSSRPRTPPFHGGNRGSNPLGDAIMHKKEAFRSLFYA